MISRHLPVLIVASPHTDAGTDCALGEVFNIEVPPGLEAVQLEVYAKHNLTGDDLIGTATISLEAIQVGLCSVLLGARQIHSKSVTTPTNDG